jgi:type IV secretory pathway component VirB8
MLIICPMRTALVLAVAAGIIAVAIIAMIASALPTKDYDLSVDALKDEQSVFTNARVVLKKTCCSTMAARKSL